MIDAIHFYKVDNLKHVRDFYETLLGLPLYKDQGACLIYDLHGHGKIGFCTHHPKNKPASSCITLVYETRAAVDAIYQRLSTQLGPIPSPNENEQFKIYHFFVNDFENFTVEFQVFL